MGVTRVQIGYSPRIALRDAAYYRQWASE